MIRWYLAEGSEEDKEVDEPKTHEEIVILKIYEEYDGAPVEITFARAGNDDLLGEELTSTAAVALYHKIYGGEAPPWAFVSGGTRREFISMAQSALAAVTEYMREKRGES